MPATDQSAQKIQSLEQKIAALETGIATMQRNVDFVNARAKAYIDRQDKAQDERFKGLERRQASYEKMDQARTTAFVQRSNEINAFIAKRVKERDKELEESIWKQINTYNGKLIKQVEQADSRIAKEIIKRDSALEGRIVKLEKLAKKK